MIEDGFKTEMEYRRVFVCVCMYPVRVCVCLCVCPVTALMSEVLNNDRNSRYLLAPAAPITGEGNTMVSMATPPAPQPPPPAPHCHPTTTTHPIHPQQIRKEHLPQGSVTHTHTDTHITIHGELCSVSMFDGCNSQFPFSLFN